MARRRRDEDEDDRREDIPAGTPRVYVHRKCGERTRMPAEAVRTYLDNPFHFGGMTHCAGCEKDVPWEKCQWVETGENLRDYMEDLQARLLLSGEDPRRDELNRDALLVVTPICLVFGVLGGLYLASNVGFPTPIGVGLGVVAGLAFAFSRMRWEQAHYRHTKKEYDEELMAGFYERHPDEKPAKRRKSRR